MAGYEFMHHKTAGVPVPERAPPHQFLQVSHPPEKLPPPTVGAPDGFGSFVGQPGVASAAAAGASEAQSLVEPARARENAPPTILGVPVPNL